MDDHSFLGDIGIRGQFYSGTNIWYALYSGTVSENKETPHE